MPRWDGMIASIAYKTEWVYVYGMGKRTDKKYYVRMAYPYYFFCKVVEDTSNGKCRT